MSRDGQLTTTEWSQNYAKWMDYWLLFHVQCDTTFMSHTVREVFRPYLHGRRQENSLNGDFHDFHNYEHKPADKAGSSRFACCSSFVRFHETRRQ